MPICIFITFPDDFKNIIRKINTKLTYAHTHREFALASAKTIF